MNRHERRQLAKLSPDASKDALIKRMKSIIEAQRLVIHKHEQTIERLMNASSNK